MCDATEEATGRKCRLQGIHEYHLVGYPHHADNPVVEWQNTTYVPPVPTMKFATKAEKAEQEKRLAEMASRSSGKPMPNFDPPSAPVETDGIAIGHEHPETSHDMAAKMVGASGTFRREVYDYIRSAPDGATDDEIEIALDRAHQSASATRNALMNDGWLYDSGLRRMTRYGNEAIVWRARPEEMPPSPAPTSLVVPEGALIDFG